MKQTTIPTPDIQRSRLAILMMFFINGAVLANWVSRIPQIQDTLELSEGQLGLVLLGLSAGVLTALSAAGGLVARYGSRRITTLSAFLLCLLLVPLPWMAHAALLWLNLFVFGMALSTMDVAMNSQAVEIEHYARRPLMSTFHAAFSIGGFVGAAIGAGMATLDIEPAIHFVVAAIGFLALTAVTQRHLLISQAAAVSEKADPVFQLPSRIFWPLGIVAFAAAIGEGAMADWSGVYLSNVVNADAGVAAFGFAVFSITMTVGRLSGDRLADRFSAKLLVQLGGLVATLGLMLAILMPQIPTTLLGFAAVGLGLSIIVPMAFSAAGRLSGISAGSGIAGVATIGYAGFLAGPPVIGLLAEWTSLPGALLLVAALTATLMVTGRALNQPPTTPGLPESHLRGAEHTAEL